MTLQISRIYSIESTKALTKNAMKDLVKKIVNLGIGAGKVAEENAYKVMNGLGNQINALIEKGGKADDKTSKKIKKFVEEAASSVDHIVKNSRSNAHEVFRQIKKAGEDLVEKLKNIDKPKNKDE